MEDAEDGQSLDGHSPRVGIERHGQHDQGSQHYHYGVSGMDQRHQDQPQGECTHGFQSHKETAPFHRDADPSQVAVEPIEHRHVTKGEEGHKGQGNEFKREELSRHERPGFQ